jgi:hypothetical protein
LIERGRRQVTILDRQGLTKAAVREDVRRAQTAREQRQAPARAHQ